MMEGAMELDTGKIRAALAGAPDFNVQSAIRAIIVDREAKVFDKRRSVFTLIFNWLKRNGHFCRTPDGRGFFFNKEDRRLYDLEQQSFTHSLVAVSGLSPTETEFRFTLAMLQAEAARAQEVTIHTFAHFDPATGVLAVSDGGPGVWRRERGADWVRGYNGERGLFFFTEPDATPVEPDFAGGATEIEWFLSRIPFSERGELTTEDHRALFLIALLQLFFPCYRRTAIIPAFLGPQGSGKSTAMRLAGRLLAGPNFDVTGIRQDKEDGFVAGVTNRVVYAVDNADSRVKWLEDALATYATRQKYQLRKLYTTNEVSSYFPRASLMLSSRDPQFRRPDVAERLLPFHLKKLGEYQDECSIFAELERRRPAIWGALFNRLAMLADSIPQIVPPAMPLRMADYAAFGWRVFAASGKERDWLAVLSRVESVQAEFASEGDGIVESIRELLSQGPIAGVEVGEMYRRCSAIAAERGLPLPRTPQGFGTKLSNLARVIELELNVRLAESRSHARRRLVTITPVEVNNDPA